MVTDIADQETTFALMYDQTNIIIYAHRGKIGILGAVEIVKTQAGAGRVDLQVKDSGLDRFLLLVAKFGKAVDKGVCDAKFH